MDELADSFTQKQFELAMAILQGKKPSEAGKIAGYASDQSTSNALNNVNLGEYISLARKKASSNAVMTREDVLNTLAEIAKGEGRFGNATGAEATGALREVSKISGFYEAEKMEISGSLVDRIRKASK